MAEKISRVRKWSLSEFLNLIELRGQCWCFAELGPADGFNVPHNEEFVFYAMLEGSAKVAGATGEPIELRSGDLIMILTGEAHAVRSHRCDATRVLEFLHENEYVDIPPIIKPGDGSGAARLLCGKLRVRWPGGQRPVAVPATLRSGPRDGIITIDALERLSKGAGAASALTRAAALVFSAIFRSHPECEQLFRDSNLHDPIARACQFISVHPFRDWTVADLARKVGMGRSNFAARFVAQLGKTPIEVLTEERMKHANHMLKQTDLKIAAISERIGYRSEAAFSRRFTTYFGISPGRMRKLAARGENLRP
jgi:AraC-like DNA-binding protein/mannose-6-phosphate isomerase-like protein (cupin superfamily)